MEKTKLVKFESNDGEIHFQECKIDACSNAKDYYEGEALELSKKEARKTLLLQRK